MSTSDLREIRFNYTSADDRQVVLMLRPSGDRPGHAGDVGYDLARQLLAVRPDVSIVLVWGCVTPADEQAARVVGRAR